MSPSGPRNGRGPRRRLVKSCFRWNLILSVRRGKKLLKLKKIIVSVALTLPKILPLILPSSDFPFRRRLFVSRMRLILNFPRTKPLMVLVIVLKFLLLPRLLTPPRGLICFMVGKRRQKGRSVIRGPWLTGNPLPRPLLFLWRPRTWHLSIGPLVILIVLCFWWRLFIKTRMNRKSLGSRFSCLDRG